MAYGWSKRARGALIVVALGLPAAIVVGACTGWSRSRIGLPAWASWTLAVPTAIVGLLLAWSSIPTGRDAATNMLFKAYRRDGLEVAEKQLLATLSPQRAGLQLFNLALALQREGDYEDAIAVYRRAAECGFPPAMFNLAKWLEQRGDEAEAQALFRRAAEAGFSGARRADTSG